MIAANAGGAWSPIGDVTTTMLWIGGQITPLAIMKCVFLPSLVNLVVPLVVVSLVCCGAGRWCRPAQVEDDGVARPPRSSAT